jgi:hypothetical protein
MKALLAALAVLATGGVEVTAEDGAQPSLTPDGRRLVYVQNDPDGVADVFVLDRRSGRRERVSVGSRGQRGNGASHGPSISNDGRFVAFCSHASNFAPNDAPPRVYPLDPNFIRDVFVRDRRARTTTNVTGGVIVRDGRSGRSTRVGAGGTTSISGDGRHVAFLSGTPLHAYVLDRSSGRMLDLGEADDVRLSADGRVAATHWSDRVVVRNLVTGRSARVDDPRYDNLYWSASFVGGISGDGRIVPFVSTTEHGVPVGERRQTLFLRVGW